MVLCCEGAGRAITQSQTSIASSIMCLLGNVRLRDDPTPWLLRLAQGTQKIEMPPVEDGRNDSLVNLRLTEL